MQERNGTDMSTRELRDLFGTAYWNNRPSFERAQKKAKRLLVTLERDDYDRVMEDIRHLKALLKEAEVDEAKFDVTNLVVNRWSPGNFQVKAFLKAKGPADDLIPDSLFQSPEPLLAGARVSPTAHPAHAFLIPDMHFGFKAWISGPDPELKWKTVHDPAAWAVMLIAIQRVRPRNIVILGDWLDLPTFSRWPTTAADKHLLNSTLAAANRALRQLRAIAPDASIVFLEGNHEARIRHLIEATMPDLGYTVEGGNPLSIEALLGLEALSIEYIGPYGSKIALGPEAYATHGSLIGRRGGDSASKVLAANRESCAFGHTHRLEMAWGSWRDAHGTRHTRWAMGCGTGARVDGTVPGSNPDCDWQQGFGVLWTPDAPDVYAIENGRCIMQGVVIDVDGLA